MKAGDLLVRLDCADPAAQLAEAEARLAASQAQAVAAGAQIQASQRARTAAGAAEEASRAQAAALAAQRDAAARQAKRLAGAPAGRARVEHRPDAGLRAGARAPDRGGEGADSCERSPDAGRGRRDSRGDRSGGGGGRRRCAPPRRRWRARALLAGRVRGARAARRGGRDAARTRRASSSRPARSLVRLVDLSEVKATFYLPNAEIGAVKPGAQATVVADAWPGESFEGTVRTVALEAEFTPRNIQTRTDRDRLVYPVEVTVAEPRREAARRDAGRR